MIEPSREDDMRCPYTGFGYCLKEKCYAYNLDNWTQKPQCKFVDQGIPPIYLGE
jgi:hypothetical protein